MGNIQHQRTLHQLAGAVTKVEVHWCISIRGQCTRPQKLDTQAWEQQMRQAYPSPLIFKMALNLLWQTFLICFYKSHDDAPEAFAV